MSKVYPSNPCDCNDVFVNEHNVLIVLKYIFGVVLLSNKTLSSTTFFLVARVTCLSMVYPI